MHTDMPAEAQVEVVGRLRAKLVDQSLPLPLRFRVLFSLRGVATREAIEALISGTR